MAEHAAGSPEPTPRLRLRSRVARVAGHLSDVRREQVARHAGATVEDYLEGAFAAGGHPFAGFVPGLRRAARSDRTVLRGAGEVGVTHAAVWFAVAAPHGRAVGLTARVAVELPSDGGPAPSVTGRLLMTKQGRAWRVFGYDLARSRR